MERSDTKNKTKQVYIDLLPLVREKSIFKMAISDRSDGKTTGAEELAVKTFDESGKSAIFSRRFGTEFTDDFFTEFEENLHVHPEVLAGRDYDIVRPSKKRLGALMLEPLEGGAKTRAVTFVPLSMAGRLKSALGYKTHKNIYLDEYIPLDNRYLPNEVEMILELYKTIDRNHFDNYVMICGNKITRFNPVFQYFNITRWKKGLNTFQNGAFSLLIYSNKGNTQACEKSTFGDLVRGTKYEAYNAGEFLRNYSELIKTSHSRIILLYIAHHGKRYAVFQSESDIVIDNAPRSGGMSAPCVCIEPQPPETRAFWLSSMPNAQSLLQAYKYSNRLFFANEMIMNDLQKVYAQI